MVAIEASVVVKTKTEQLKSSIIKEILPKINNKFRSWVRDKQIKSFIDSQIKNRIINSQFYYEMVYGDLRTDLNVDNPELDFATIMQTLSSSIDINFTSFKFIAGNISGGVTIKIFKENMDDILSLPIFSKIQNNDFYWLRETLNSTNLNFSFDISFDNLGFLNVQVPQEFKGRIDNNWMTDAFSSFENELKAFLEEKLSKEL